MVFYPVLGFSAKDLISKDFEYFDTLYTSKQINDLCCLSCLVFSHVLITKASTKLPQTHSHSHCAH